MRIIPEKIWIDVSGGNWSPVSGGTQEEEYNHKGLPLTDEQFFNDPRVKVLIEALEFYSYGHARTPTSKSASDALARIREIKHG
jgi:hypothetical protein